jgi:hypothetical protein
MCSELCNHLHSWLQLTLQTVDQMSPTTAASSCADSHHALYTSKAWFLIAIGKKTCVLQLWRLPAQSSQIQKQML